MHSTPFPCLEKLRVVTQEDVKFTRFRRDEVGVFELKGMIETNTANISIMSEELQAVADGL
jgi:hypothetical protein